MSVKTTKNGIIYSDNIYESGGCILLNGAEKYTRSNPYTTTSASTDGWILTDMYAEITPNKTYYLCCETDCPWAKQHPGNKGEVTIWLYMLKTYDPSNFGFDTPYCYTSSNWVRKGVWKITIPADFYMARVRFNTYSDGTNAVTAKFWDIKLIPEKYFVASPPLTGVPSLHIGKDYISSGEIIEM